MTTKSRKFISPELNSSLYLKYETHDKEDYSIGDMQIGGAECELFFSVGRDTKRTDLKTLKNLVSEINNFIQACEEVE